MTENLSKKPKQAEPEVPVDNSSVLIFIVPSLWSWLHVSDLRDSFAYETVLSLQ